MIRPEFTRRFGRLGRELKIDAYEPGHQPKGNRMCSVWIDTSAGPGIRIGDDPDELEALADALRGAVKDIRKWENEPRDCPCCGRKLEATRLKEDKSK